MDHPRRAGRGNAADPPRAGSASVDREPEPEAVARSIALRQLTTAARSRAQLEQAMARRAVPADVAARVLDRFEEVGLVDDASYAEAFVRSRHVERGLSRGALARELRARGIPEDIASAAIADLDEEDERETARALVRRRAPATAGLDLQRRRRRLAGMLARRGYPSAVALGVVDEILGEAADAPGP